MTPSASSRPQSRAAKAKPMPAHPWRSLLICAALFALGLAVLRDLGLHDPLTVLTDLGLAPDAPETDGGGTLLLRIAADPVRLIFALGCCAMLLFAALQTLCLMLDTRLVLAQRRTSGVMGAPAQIIRLLSGRHLHIGHPESRREDAFQIAAEGDVMADPLRLGLTAFPMLGFLGTVVGLSGAIESLPAAMGNPDALQPVLSELHIAFDTTLLGLIGALICLAGSKMVEQAWDRLARTAGHG